MTITGTVSTFTVSSAITLTLTGAIVSPVDALWIAGAGTVVMEDATMAASQNITLNINNVVLAGTTTSLLNVKLMTSSSDAAVNGLTQSISVNGIATINVLTKLGDGTTTVTINVGSLSLGGAVDGGNKARFILLQGNKDADLALLATAVLSNTTIKQNVAGEVFVVDVTVNANLTDSANNIAIVSLLGTNDYVKFVSSADTFADEWLEDNIDGTELAAIPTTGATVADSYIATQDDGTVVNLPAS